MPVRRRARAVPAALIKLELRWRLLDRYGADPEFSRHLKQLFAGHIVNRQELPAWADLDWRLKFEAARADIDPEQRLAPEVVSYIQAVGALVARWGLDRFTGPEGSGAELIHEWCQNRRIVGPRLTPRELASVLGGYAPTDDIGEEVHRSEVVAGPFLVVEPVIRPRVRVSFVDEWDPQREHRGHARQRLTLRAAAAVNAELDRLELDAVNKAYQFPAPTPNISRDLDWLFAVMSRRSTIAAIAESMGAPIDGEVKVIKAVRRMAARAGVSLKGLGLGRLWGAP